MTESYVDTTRVLAEDLESLCRLTGCAESSLAGPVVHEYLVRLRMFHSDGRTGPLGTLALIDLLRYLDIGPQPVPPVPRRIDWSKMPRDLRVEARRTDPATKEDRWYPGIYRGPVGMGSLAVLLDGKTWVDEFAAKDLRLPQPIDLPAAAHAAADSEEEEESEEDEPDEHLEVPVAKEPVKC